MDDFELSRATLKKSYNFMMSAKKLNMPLSLGMFDRRSKGDALWFIFVNTDKVAIVLCCPSCYLVTYGRKEAEQTDPDVEYYIIENRRTFLLKLKKLGFRGATEDDMEDLAELALEAKELESHITDEDDSDENDEEEDLDEEE